MNKVNYQKGSEIVTPIKHTKKISVENGESVSVKSDIAEPFNVGRETPRLLFDFSVMISLLNKSFLNYPILDFGAGTGWVSEFCARMSLQVVAFDIHGKLQVNLENRARSDSRIDERLLNFAHGDGHNMPFETETFGHLLCYDTLHHMHDYPKVFSEFFRVLGSGGRGIFVEPGARHSSSKETIEFIKSQKEKNPSWDWIERDVVLEEIDAIARKAGFKEGIFVVPMPTLVALQVYSFEEWKKFRKGEGLQRLRLTDYLADINYWDRVIFYVDKPIKK